MANTPPRDPFGGLLMWFVLTCGLVLAAAIWAWPHVPLAWRFPYFFGVIVVFDAVAVLFAIFSRARDTKTR